MNRIILWRGCLAACAILSIVTFTPLVTPAGEFEPTVAGIPYSLWTGVLVAFALVGLTYVAGLVHPERRNPDDAP